MVIFDCEDFQIIQRKGRNDFLLVTFSSLGMFNEKGSLADGQTFWARGLSEAFDYSAIGFVAKHKDWFCSSSMEVACAKVAAISASYKSVLAYGSSMGGYGALRWGSAVGAKSVVAFAPQYSIEPVAVASFDRRFEYAYSAPLHVDMGLKLEKFPPATFIFFDPTCQQDRRHVELIKQRDGSPIFISLGNCGQECVRVVASKVVADKLLSLCAIRDVDGVRKLAAASRRRAPIRALTVATRAITRRRALALKIFNKHQAGFEFLQKSKFLKAIGSEPEQTTCVGSSGAGNQTSSTNMRLIHLHVPKTAGTALRTAFEKHFRGNLRIFPEWDESKYAAINPDDFDFYSGHIGFETAKRLNGDIVTVLRDPVDRFVSVYYFWRQLYESGKERSPNTELATMYSLDEFSRMFDQANLIEEFQNRCTFQIAYGSSTKLRREARLSGLNDDALFKTALNNLRSFKVVGIQERLDRFASAIQSNFGVSLGIEKINVTQGRQDISNISISTKRRIHDWLYMDIELYQEALRLVG